MHNQLDSHQTGARHARLFELIRQKNLAAMELRAAQSKRQPSQADARAFAAAASRSLSADERQSIGYSASFGR